jgi:hypothetical protein
MTRKDRGQHGVVLKELWQEFSFSEPIDEVTGQTVGAQYGIQQTLSGVAALVLAEVKPITGRYSMFNNPFATNAVKTTQIHSWWYHYVTKVEPAMSNTNRPCAYISVIFISFSLRRFWSDKILRSSAILPPDAWQWSISARRRWIPCMASEQWTRMESNTGSHTSSIETN